MKQQSLLSRGTYSVHVQGVHCEVVRMQVQGLEELLHGDLLALQLVHYAFGVHAVRFLDEAQQVLLVHAGSSVDVGVDLGRQRRGGELRRGNRVRSQEGGKELKRATNCVTEVSEDNNS